MRIFAPKKVSRLGRRSLHAGAAIAAAFSVAILAGCSSDDAATKTTGTTVTCGVGTELKNNACVPTSTPDTLTCGAGTKLDGDKCVPEDTSTLACGDGTEELDGKCVPSDAPIACGPGTEEQDGACVPTALEPGHFQNPLLLQKAVYNVGSHTDEVRITENNLLLNCSYTFNILDATNPASMSVLTAKDPGLALKHIIPGDARKPGCKHLAWDANLVFTTHLGNINNPPFLSGWDITNPKAPVQLKVLQEPGIHYETVDVANHHIYVALHDAGIGAYDYDAANGFTRIGSLGGFTEAWGLAARGNDVFVADGAGGFVTVDATDPTNLVEKGRVAIGGFAKGVVVDGNYAYVAANSAGVAVVDISNMASPQVVSQISMPGTAIRVAFSEGRIFVAAWNDVRVYDVTTPAAPKFVAAVRVPRVYNYGDPNRELPTHRVFGVAAKGTDVFVGTWDNPFSYKLQPDVVAPNLRLPETAVRFDLGLAAVGEKKTKEFKVTNQGTAPLTIVDTWVAGSEAFSVEPRQLRLQPGEEQMLTLTYVAMTTDQEIGYVNILSDDPAYPVRKIYVVGNSPGLVPGSTLPTTTGTMLDGSTWTSDQTFASGHVLLLTYFGTFCPVCANHLPDTEERFWKPYQNKGLEVVALNTREGIDKVDLIQNYIDSLEVTYPTGLEETGETYDAIVANFPGNNPFPVDVIIGKDGVVRYASHEYDPDTMTEIIDAAIAE